jgi:hypothetical protein
MLSNALREATKSASVQEWASGAGVSLRYLSAEDTAARMFDLSSFYAQYKDLLQSN